MIKFKGLDRFYKQHQDCIDSVYQSVFNSGKHVDGDYCRSVEQKLKNITGRKHAAVVSSGTSAILTAMLALDLQNKSVAVANYSYIASANQAALQNRISLVDVDLNGVIMPSAVPACDAVVPVSLYGNTPDYDQLPGVTTIADCAQSLGSTYKGKPDGAFGDIAVFSFSGNKPVPTTGTAGALVWDDDAITDRILLASRNGKLSRNTPVASLGINAEPFELQAGIVDIGLDYMLVWQARRNAIHQYYTECFRELPLGIIEPADYCVSNRHKFVLLFKQRDQLHDYLNNNGVESQKHYTDNFADYFDPNNSDRYPGTKRLCKYSLSLPNHQWLLDSEVETVAHTVKSFFK